MNRSKMLFGVILGSITAAVIINSKKSADALIKKGKDKIKDKVNEILD